MIVALDTVQPSEIGGVGEEGVGREWWHERARRAPAMRVGFTLRAAEHTQVIEDQQRRMQEIRAKIKEREHLHNVQIVLPQGYVEEDQEDSFHRVLDAHLYEDLYEDLPIQQVLPALALHEEVGHVNDPGVVEIEVQPADEAVMEMEPADEAVMDIDETDQDLEEPNGPSAHQTRAEGRPEPGEPQRQRQGARSSPGTREVNATLVPVDRNRPASIRPRGATDIPGRLVTKGELIRFNVSPPEDPHGGSPR